MKTVKNLECFSLSEKNYVTSFFFASLETRNLLLPRFYLLLQQPFTPMNSSALFPYLDLLILFNQLNCMTLV